MSETSLPTTEPFTVERHDDGSVWYRVGGVTVALAMPLPLHDRDWWTVTLVATDGKFAGATVLSGESAQAICELHARVAAEAVAR